MSMNLEQLIDQFDLVTDNEEGLEQLRKLILKLAVQGKLTKQDSSDESVEDLLERIEQVKNKLYEERKIRKPRSLKPLKPDEIPFEIPSNWEWCKIGDIGKIQGGGTPKTSNDEYWADEGISWLTPADLNGNGKYISRGRRDISKKGLENSSTFLLPKGTVLFSSRAPIGYVAIADQDLATNQGFQSCIPYEQGMNSYIYYYLKYVGEILDERASGTTFKEVSGTFVANVEFPLPPLEEQQRIVQKIVTLFSQVDELEKKVQQDREVDERLQVAVLDDLQSAETPEVSKQSWQRLTDHFEQIYRKPEHIDQLKQAILNEAVRGRLVPQNPDDESAEKLLERIKEEKQRLYSEGEIRKPKDLDPVSSEEIPFGLPRNWKWVRLGDICQLITDGAHHTPNYIEDGVRFISVKNISGGEIDFTDCKYISEKEHEKLSQRCNPERGDILLTKVGTTGIPVVVETDIEFSIFVSVALLKINTDFVNPYFLKYLIQSPLVYSQSLENTRGVGNQNLVLRDINNFTIPFMPYKDQIKLTEEIERYFTWCDDLKEKLSRSQQTDQRLLEALVDGALEDDGKSKESEEATIYQMPGSRVREKKIAKVSGMDATDVQAGIMARVINGYERYNGEKKHLGRTKMEKVCHIVESHTRLDLGRKPKRMQFGSADYTRLRNKVEPRARKLGWFNFEEDENGIVYYKKGTRFHEPFQKLGHKLVDKSDEIDRIIELFIPLSTRDAEVRQTVYAAWHDLIAYGKEPTDEEIVLFASTEKYWAKEKEDIPKKEFYEGIGWLRKNDLVPDGTGKLTVKN